MRRASGLSLAVMLAMPASANAFDFDGFNSSMTMQDVAIHVGQKITMVKYPQSVEYNAGPYSFSFCNGHLDNLTAKKPEKDFYATLAKWSKVLGKPELSVEGGGKMNGFSLNWFMPKIHYRATWYVFENGAKMIEMSVGSSPVCHE